MRSPPLRPAGQGHARIRSSSGRLRRRCRPRLGELEARTLLSATAGDLLAATWIDLGTTQTDVLDPGAVAFFRIDPYTDGRLVVQVHSQGVTTRLSLLD